MPAQHENLAAGKWFTMSFAEQLGNIGSEVGRAGSWQRKGNQEYFDKASERMLELLDLTIADQRWAGSKRGEMTRVREALCDSFFGDQSMGGSTGSWDKYFMPFAILARSKYGTL